MFCRLPGKRLKADGDEERLIPEGAVCLFIALLGQRGVQQNECYQCQSHDITMYFPL